MSFAAREIWELVGPGSLPCAVVTHAVAVQGETRKMYMTAVARALLTAKDGCGPGEQQLRDLLQHLCAGRFFGRFRGVLPAGLQLTVDGIYKARQQLVTTAQAPGPPALVAPEPLQPPAPALCTACLLAGYRASTLVSCLPVGCGQAEAVQAKDQAKQWSRGQRQAIYATTGTGVSTPLVWLRIRPHPGTS